MEECTHTSSITDSMLSKMDHAYYTERNKRDYQYMKNVKVLNISDFAPPIKIQHIESPFKWIQVLKNENLSSCNCYAKIDDCKNQGDDYTFEKFMPYMALAFEHSLLKQFEEAKYFLDKVEEMLCTMQSNNYRFYSKIRLALEHVFLATKTNILILENEKSEEVDELMEKCSNLKPVGEMDSVQQAAIHAFKSKFYFSCTTENDLALAHIREANRRDPTCPTWKYWTGIILRKIRRDKNDDDVTEELAFFEEAALLDRNAKHVVFLAQGFREKAFFLRRNKNVISDIEKDDLFKEMDFLNERSCELYMESVELNPNSAAICRRAGNGLMTLPKQYAKYRVAKQLLHKAEKLSRNPVTFHILGTYYLKYEQNEDKAVEYFQKTADNNMLYGYHELIKIKYLNDPDYDILEDLLKAEKSLEFSSNLASLEGDIGWYYMISQNNVYKGLEYFWKIIEKDENSKYIKKFYSYSFVVKGPLNIYRILKEKILNVEEELRDDLMIRFLDKVNSNPQLLEESNDCVTLKQAQAESVATIKWLKKLNQNKDKFSYSNQCKSVFLNMSSKSQKNSVRNLEEKHNWQREHDKNNLARASEERRQAADKAPPKQDNWRLECRKF